METRGQNPAARRFGPVLDLSVTCRCHGLGVPVCISFKNKVRIGPASPPPPLPESGGSGHRHTLSPATPHGPPTSAATSPVNAPAGRWKGGVGRVLRGPRLQKLALSCSAARRAQAGGSAEPGGAPTEIAPGSKEGRSPPRCGQARDSRRWTQLEISWTEWESGPR